MVAAAAAAPQSARMEGAVGQGINRWEPGQPEFAPDRVLVRFKATPTAKAAAAVQADRPLPGLQLQRLVGEYHRVKVPPPLQPGTAAAAAATGTRTVPSDALMLFDITDGASVPAKVAQLRANPGERWRGGRSVLEGGAWDGALPAPTGRPGCEASAPCRHHAALPPPCRSRGIC